MLSDSIQALNMLFAVRYMHEAAKDNKLGSRPVEGINCPSEVEPRFEDQDLLIGLNQSLVSSK